MTRSKRMDIVLRVTAGEEDKAAQAFSQAGERLQQEQTKLTQLSDYQNEYQQQMLSAQATAISVQQLQQYSTFLSRLREAVKQQSEAYQRQLKAHQHLRELWIEARARTQSIKQLKEKYLADEFSQADRQEQKQVDELVNNRHAQALNKKARR